MEKTCANCFYNNRKMSDTPCNTCMSISNESKDNWTGVDEEEYKCSFCANGEKDISEYPCCDCLSCNNYKFFKSKGEKQ